MNVRTPTIREDIENALIEKVAELFEAHVCCLCKGAYTERGARTKYGLQITPDEVNCPTEFDPSEKGCVHAASWEECVGYAKDIAAWIDGARDW
ncbi:MAG: hypothetical protein K6E42_08895 [Synergistes sp.]|nr:hypothetical protein [Synergistes sp.]